MRCLLANKHEIVVVLSKTPIDDVFQPNKCSPDVQFQKFPKLKSRPTSPYCRSAPNSRGRAPPRRSKIPRRATVLRRAPHAAAALRPRPRLAPPTRFHAPLVPWETAALLLRPHSAGATGGRCDRRAGTVRRPLRLPCPTDAAGGRCCRVRTPPVPREAPATAASAPRGGPHACPHQRRRSQEATASA